MTDLQSIILYSSLAGVTIFLGGLLSHYFGHHLKSGFIKKEIIHISIAFGGGLLLAALSLVLVPEGMKALALGYVLIFFALGTVGFFFLDRYIAKKGKTISQLMGMLLDLIPESLTMGAVYSTNHQLGLLLAAVIGLQNLPESFNAYLDLKSIYSSRKSLFILFLLSFSGLGSALLGYYLFSDSPKIVGGLMLFSSGGMIYLIFQDIAPMSKLKKNWIPALGASLGFLMGMVGVSFLG
ncbi:MAG: divalent cation transporter [Bacteroidetes bacterium]|nr:MAG: divalent cation transporter [Bacteroidota bacterium]